jgi:hypothetical protein
MAPTEAFGPLSLLPRFAAPTYLHKMPPFHSIPMGPASAATAGGSIQTALSNAREHRAQFHLFAKTRVR